MKTPSLTPTATADPQVAIIGAGPYGLGAAAHLHARGVSTQVFGVPMDFWSSQMPVGMLLRSPYRASHLTSPGRTLTLDKWAADQGTTVKLPIPLEDFVAYGRWFAERSGAPIDERLVAQVERDEGGFTLTLDDDTVLHPERVVVAAGLYPFGRVPAPFDRLPSELVTHACDVADLTPFAGRRLAVIGAGQSALESAALLHEVGAQVEVLARKPAIRWLPGDDERPLTQPLYPPTGVGGRMTGWIAAAPDVYRRVSATRRSAVRTGCLKPAGSHWLRARLADVPLTVSTEVHDAQATADGTVELRLGDGTTRGFDHVFLGTGYSVDVARYPFLSNGLGEQVRRTDGMPLLRSGLESSVPGLHFLGAPAVHSFGPIMRFVTGSWYAAPALADSVTGARRGNGLRLAYA